MMNLRYEGCMLFGTLPSGGEASRSLQSRIGLLFLMIFSRVNLMNLWCSSRSCLVFSSLLT